MSDQADNVERQWVSLPGGSCDVRIGGGALEHAGKLFRDTVGTPRACLMVLEEGIDEELAERVRRQLVGEGFRVIRSDMPEEASVRQAARLVEALAAAGITSDDLVCAAGGANLLSVVTFVGGSWCGGTPVCAVPLDPSALLEGILVPRALSAAGEEGMIGVRPWCKRAICDLDVMSLDPQSEPARLTRVLMVATAMCESERDFSTLWDAADKIMAGDLDAWVQAYLRTARGRGHLISSTSLAIRQSVAYGRTFAAALEALFPGQVPLSTRLSEALRFAGRVSAGTKKLSVDDMLAQDDLLSMLGVDDTAAVAPDPQQLIDALKAERFKRSNRFLLTIPAAIGRVRLSSVEDDVLLDHVNAWCTMHGF